MRGVEVDDRLGPGASSTSCVAVGQVGRRDGAWPIPARDGRASIRTPRPAGIGQGRASGRRRGRRSPAAGCTGRTGRRPSSASARAGRRADGPDRSRAARVPNHSSRSRPAASSRTVPTRGEVGQLGRDDRRSPRPRSPRRRAPCDAPRARRAMTGARPVLATDDGRRALPIHRQRDCGAEPVDAPGGPAVGHPADPVVVGRRAPEREPGRGGEQRVDEPTVAVELRGHGRRRLRPGRAPSATPPRPARRRAATRARRPRSRPAPSSRSATVEPASGQVASPRGSRSGQPSRITMVDGRPGPTPVRRTSRRPRPRRRPPAPRSPAARPGR